MMPAHWVTTQVILVLFVATLVRSAFGFGEALISVPLLALVMPIEVAAPTAVLVSITVALIIVIQDWHRVHVNSALWLVVPTFLGIPLGLLLLKKLPEPVVEAILGIVVAAFALYCLTSRRSHELKDDRLAGFFGFTAGVLGGAYGMNGPPLAIYGSLRRWSPEHFRATLQAYFLPASLAGMGGYWFGGLWTPAVNRFYLISLPGVFVAIFLGRAINRRLQSGRFVRYVYVGLTLIGAVLLLKALAGWSALKPPA
jgi:uncharacterized membrane protein YfcA